MKKNVNGRFARWKTHFVSRYEEKGKRTVYKMEDTFCLYIMKKNVNGRFARWKTHFVSRYEEKDERRVCKMKDTFCLYI